MSSHTMKCVSAIPSFGAGDSAIRSLLRTGLSSARDRCSSGRWAVARTTFSASAGRRLMSRRNSGCAITSTRPALLTRAVRKRRWPGQQGQLANERTRAKCDDDDLILPIGSHHHDLTLENDEQVVGRLSSLEEELAARHRLLSPKPGHFGELGRAQHGPCESVCNLRRAHEDSPG